MSETKETMVGAGTPTDLRGNLLEPALIAADRTPYSVFLLYMRINDDGRFVATQYYHRGNLTDAIDPSPDYDANAKTLGYYVKEMALGARNPPSTFQEHGRGMEEIKFPRRFSYCVFFLDEPYWSFETERESGEDLPIIYFKKRKKSKIYKDHAYAFRRLPLIEMEMPREDGTQGTEIRQAAVMINRMRNENDQPLGNQVEEKFCFDFPVQIQYDHSSDSFGLVIDPTGTNLGPPEPPPPV